MMNDCQHHYEFKHGHFICKYCGHERKKSYKQSKKAIKPTIILASIVIMIFFVYQNQSIVLQYVQPVFQQIQNVSKSVNLEPKSNIEPKNNLESKNTTVTTTIPTIKHLQDTNKVSPALTSQSSQPHQINPTVQQNENQSSSFPLIHIPLLPPRIVIPDLEQKIHVLINQQRQNYGLQPLTFDQTISTIARNHSLDMATRNYFAHETPEGLTASQRGINAGYSNCGDKATIALDVEIKQENITITQAQTAYDIASAKYQKDAQEFQQYYSSDTVRYNVLQAEYQKLFQKQIELNGMIDHYNTNVNLENERSSAGMLFSGFSENIFQNNLYDVVTYYNGIPSYHWLDMDALAFTTVDGWMHSAGHRANILTPYYSSEGIGVGIASDDKVYITEDFC